MAEDESTPRDAEASNARVDMAVGPAASSGAADVYVEAQEAQEGTPEENKMIDVHAPHGGIHTWKDFWIHLGTIALGLLIAIGLEQTVEYFHHLHQRHQLEDDLRTEGENNHRHAQIDIALYDKIVTWLVQLQHGVDAARASGGKAAFVYPPRPDGIPDSPRYVAYHVLQTEVWTTAKESSMVGLLTQDEAQVFARLYIQADQVQSTRERTRDAGIQQGAFETRFSQGIYPPVFDVSKLTPQHLDEYEALLANELESVRIATVRLKIFDAANNYVLSGRRSEGELREAILRANMPQ